ncbi:zinc finger protein ZAT11-like [Magnolia sinica]|uniref:zinc finger protein ZAT11-like n=1 Tax=Magnolia sinica TaxID=86752 RepID=UPI00265978C9|nr:zinc finger protein ZAT11-like [Magnolia sinica]
MKRFREEMGVDTESTSVATWLMLLAHGSTTTADHDDHMAHQKVGRIFECKTCNRRFPSFQALGGHRASHKKPRSIEGHHDRSRLKPRTHECSICGLEFAIGQALGGHMRRHRNMIDGYPEAPAVKRLNTSAGVRFDLNLTPLENDLESAFVGKINVVH